MEPDGLAVGSGEALTESSMIRRLLLIEFSNSAKEPQHRGNYPPKSQEANGWGPTSGVAQTESYMISLQPMLSLNANEV